MYFYDSLTRKVYRASVHESVLLDMFSSGPSDHGMVDMFVNSHSPSVKMAALHYVLNNTADAESIKKVSHWIFRNTDQSDTPKTANLTSYRNSQLNQLPKRAT